MNIQLFQNHYNLLRNSLLINYMYLEVNELERNTIIVNQVIRLKDLTQLNLLDKLIIYNLHLKGSYVNININFIYSIINDLRSLNKDLIIRIYYYYITLNSINIFLNYLNLFINNNLNNLNEDIIKENVAIIMEVFKPYEVKSESINNNGLIKCAITLNKVKS